MTFEQLQAPAAADRVGDPRADHRAEQPGEHDPDHRHVVVGGALAGIGDGEAGEQHHHLGGDRDAGRADRHQREDPGQARVAHEVRGGVDERLGDRCEDEHAPGNDTVPFQMRVWIDLTNSPHVLVMRPVIERLQAEGHEVEVTARDFAQTLALCERFGIAHTAIGHHRGERLGAKATGLASRSAALVRWARAGGAGVRRFDIALGHGSNDVSVAAALLRIPSATMFDYEWATVQHNVNCRLARAVVVPDAIPPARLERYGARGKIRAYEGLKEEYYLADFEPDAGVLDELGLDATRPIVVVRTPPEVSLYHRFENDLFARVLQRLREAAAADGVQPVVLPRVDAQRRELAGVPGFVVPERAIDAQSLIAYADLVISAGGTMNREAVALGTPVYTTFEGRLGAVDERLIEEGRLRKLAGSGGARPASAALPARRGAARAARPAGAGGAVAEPAERLSSPYNRANAPTDPRGGPSHTPALPAPARGGWGAGRARLLPRVRAALRQRRQRRLAPAARLRAAAANGRSGGCWGGAWSCSSWRGSTSAAGATPGSATTRRSCGRSC